MTKLALKQYARARGIFLKDLADETGISVNTIYGLSQEDIESIKFVDVKKICDVLRITPNQLFNYSIEGWREK